MADSTEDLADAWLAEDPLPLEPCGIVADWLREAFEAGLQANPHAVALATVDPDGRPSARTVLCNRIDAERGEFVMFTNRESRKGRAIAANPRAAIVFHFAPQNRSVRVEGAVRHTPDQESDAYFATRPLDARVGAWASAQSEPIESRAALVARVEATARRFGVRLDDESDADIPRPPHWGGFTLTADTIELWVSRPARIHDRARYIRGREGGGAWSAWSVQRLQP